MTREEMIELAGSVEERVAGYMRESERDPKIDAALRRRYVPSMPQEPANDAPAATAGAYAPVDRVSAAR